MGAMTTKEFADGLRAMADWYEAHPEVPPPLYPEFLHASVETKEEAVTIAEALKPCAKQYNGGLFELHRLFGPIRLKFLFWREVVCERHVVGVKDVPEATVPAHAEEIVEWDCHPLLKPDADAAP